MKIRVSIVLALSLLSVLSARAQTDNTLYVRNFKGTDVGTKVTNAMASCNPSTVIPCILVIDPSLAGYPAGTMPILCSQCSVMDWRHGPPSGGVALVIPGANISCSPDVAGSCKGNVTVNSSGGGGGGSPLGTNINLTVDGTSEEIGFNRQQEYAVTSAAAGSGYTCSGGCTNNTVPASISGATCTVPPTGEFSIDPNGSGGAVFSLTFFGQTCTGVATATPNGFTAGSGASATLTPYPLSVNYPNPWPNILSTLPAFAGLAQNCGGGSSSPCFTNYALTSQTVAGAIANYTTNGYHSICSDTTHKQVFILSGVLIQNSINVVVGNIPVAIALGQWTALARRLKADGCTLIVTTPFNVLVGAGNDSTANDTVSKFLRTGTRGVDFDYLIDFGAMVQNTTDTQLLAYDNTHQTATGERWFAYNGSAALMTGGTFVMGKPGYFANATVLGTLNTKLFGLTDSGSETPTLANQFEMQYYSANPGVTTFAAGSSGGTAGSFGFQTCTSVPTCTTALSIFPTVFGVFEAATFSSSITASGGIISNTVGMVNGGYSGGGVANKAAWSYLSGQTTFLGSSPNTTLGGFTIRGQNNALSSFLDYQTMIPTGDTFGVPIIAPSSTFTSAAPTVSTGQIGYGGTTAAATNCGSLTSAIACILVNVAGTAHYVPYY